MGRPSTYTDETAQAICARLATGEPLAVICRDEGMPAVRTVSLWKEDHPDFAAEFARARDEGYDVIGADCMGIADDARNDWMRSKQGEKVLDAEHVQRSKLRIETRLKLLAKWDPKRYGDRLNVDATVQHDVGDRLERALEALKK